MHSFLTSPDFSEDVFICVREANSCNQKPKTKMTRFVSSVTTLEFGQCVE